MSINGNMYEARIAPCAETWREAIRLGVEVVDEGRLVRESFAPKAFGKLNGAPVVLDHDESKPVGRILNGISHRGWLVVDFLIDHSKPLSAIALDRLKVGAPVSIGAHSHECDKLLEQDGIVWHTRATLDELSILQPGGLPAYRGAAITHIYPPPKTSPARAKPKPKPKPPVPRAIAAAVPASTAVYRTTRKPQVDHHAELQRRIDFAEANGHYADIEMIVRNMQDELRPGGIDRAWADHLRRRAA
jgi:hypothetical protein